MKRISIMLLSLLMLVGLDSMAFSDSSPPMEIGYQIDQDQNLPGAFVIDFENQGIMELTIFSADVSPPVARYYILVYNIAENDRITYGYLTTDVFADTGIGLISRYTYSLKNSAKTLDDDLPLIIPLRNNNDANYLQKSFQYGMSPMRC